MPLHVELLPPPVLGLIVVDEGALEDVDDEGCVEDLNLHVELLHPRDRQELNASMIPRIQDNQRHDCIGMYST